MKHSTFIFYTIISLKNHKQHLQYLYEQSKYLVYLFWISSLNIVVSKLENIFMIHKIEVKEEIVNLPAKEYLKKYHLFSTRYLKNIKVYGNLYINRQKSRMIDPINQGDIILIRDRAENIKNTIQLKAGAEKYIIYNNDNYLIVNKDGNLLTHDNYVGANSSLAHLIGEGDLHLVNRLDRNTSGLLIIAKSSYYHHLFSQCQIEKIYFLACHGQVRNKHFFIDYKIARKSDSIIERVCTDEGKSALSEFYLIDYDETKDITYLLCKIHTGRTHQIRVHSLYMSHPLLGDTLYGLDRLKEINPKSYDNLISKISHNTRKKYDQMIGRQYLHALYISFKLKNQEKKEFEALIPDELSSTYKSNNEFKFKIEEALLDFIKLTTQ